jgi:hypothetical protein
MDDILKCLVTGWLCLNLCGVSAQKSDGDVRKLILSPGVSWQGGLFEEMNLMLARSIIETGGNAFWGPRLGIETNFNSGHFIYALKFGYELSGLLICLRGNAILYVDGQKTDLRLLPEAGFSLFGAVDLTYGYSIPLLKSRINESPNHRITLIFNLHRELWKAL